MVFFLSPDKQEGPELEVKLELGSAGFCPGKLEFKSLGLGIKCQKWE